MLCTSGDVGRCCERPNWSGAHAVLSVVAEREAQTIRSLQTLPQRFSPKDKTNSTCLGTGLNFSLSPQHLLFPLAHNTLYASHRWRTQSRNASPPTTERTVPAPLPLRSLATTPSVSAAKQHPPRFSPLVNSLRTGGTCCSSAFEMVAGIGTTRSCRAVRPVHELGPEPEPYLADLLEELGV